MTDDEDSYLGGRKLSDSFQGRRPSFDRRGNVRGFRSRPGAPQSEFSSGRMTDSLWVSKFTNTGSQVQAGALRERMAGGGDMSNPETYKGISEGVIDSVMGKGTWGKIIGRQGSFADTPNPFATANPFSIRTFEQQMPANYSQPAKPNASLSVEDERKNAWNKLFGMLR